MPSPRVLLVEGNDDRHVILSLLQYYGLPENFSVHPSGGIDRLLETLPVQLKGSGVERVGVIVDADQEMARRWQSIKAIASKLGYEYFPDDPETSGTVIVSEERPHIGVWLMPNNVLSGVLEDFIRFLVPEGDVLLTRASDVVAAIPEHDVRFRQQDRSKALVHTWLAWQQSPGTPMGLAITKRYLEADAPAARGLIDWLRRLFS